MNNEFKKLTSEDEWNDLLKYSEKDPVVIFKYSATCPTSVEAEGELEDFMSENDIPVYRLVVQDSRELSDLIADELDVKHESPQIIVVESGMAVFDASHYDVTKDVLEETLKKE